MIPLPLLLLLPLQAPQVGDPREPGIQLPAEEATLLWTPQEWAALELLRSLRKKERPPEEELAARLATHGESLLPLYFEVLRTRRVPGPEGQDPQILSEIQEDVLLLGVEQLDRDRVLTHVETQMALTREPECRLAAQALIGAVGHGNDFPALFALALELGETQLDRRQAKALERAVTSILKRDPKAFERLAYLRRVVPPEILPTIVSAVGATHDGAGLEFLAEVAYWNKNLIQEVMSQVRLVGLADEESVNEAMRVRIRPYLDEAQPGTCRAAIMALTTLEDFDSIASLITLLGSEDSGLAGNAHWSLKTLTGLSLTLTQENWSRWHQAELAWMVRQKPREFQRLRSNDPAEVAAALRTILTHRLALEELRKALPELLRHRTPVVRALACRTLAELKQAESVSNLVWALEDPSPEVVQAAYQALKLITGLDLEHDPLVWQAATNTEPAETQL